ncbi:MAG: hypothetical protein Q7S28_02625 [bacterium]|nr:hypothetical protein [bacterium]
MQEQHKKTLRTDYHFHPNLPKNEKRAVKKVRRIFKAFDEFEITTVIIAEHAYKEPKRAWKIMMQEKPSHITLIPGLEYVTSEDIDIVMFSNKERIYDMPELAPFSMNYREAVQFVHGNEDLHAFVTHPFTLGRTSLAKKLGEDFTKEMIHALGAVEVSYSPYDKMYDALRLFPFRKMRARALMRLALNDFIPSELLPKDIRFFAAGSDAHHVWDIGAHMELPFFDGDDHFKVITNNKGGPVISFRSEESYTHSIIDVLTSIREGNIKRRLKRKLRREKGRFVVRPS